MHPGTLSKPSSTSAENVAPQRHCKDRDNPVDERMSRKMIQEASKRSSNTEGTA